MSTLHLIDGSGYVFRAYHALPPLSTSTGIPTGAVRGVLSMLLKDLREQKPTHVAVCMDRDARLQRMALYPEYKANRPPPPPDLTVQFDLLRKLIPLMGIPLLEVSGYEADDIIATLDRRASEAGFDVMVVSGDKDLMQLVDDGRVRLYDAMRDVTYDEAGVRAKWGVPPRLIGDLLSLTGDTVDNVPGVPGVGPKTAVALLEQFGNLDGVLEGFEQIARPKLRESVAAHLDTIRLARRLVALDAHVPLPLELDELRLRAPDAAALRIALGELELFRLLRDIPNLGEVGTAGATEPSSPAEQTDPASRTADPIDVRETLPAAAHRQVVRTREALSDLQRALLSQPRIALEFVWAGPHARTAPLAGLSVGFDDRAIHVPLAPPSLIDPVLRESEVLEALRPVFESPTPIKDGHGLKSVATALLARGIQLQGLGIDLELGAFLLQAGRREHPLDLIAQEELGLQLPAWPVDAKGKFQPATTAVELMTPVCCERVDAVRRLAPRVEARLRSEKLWELYEGVERPVLPLLSAMEVRGIAVDTQALRSQGTEVDAILVSQVQSIHALAGTEFNVNAPAQLAEVLFDRLGLPVLRRGKTGPSTDAEVLEKLAEQHPLPGAVLEYRANAKLKNTYLDTLPEQIEPDGRIHTTFNPIGAATGRLSSNDPNLQNIPIRTELGRRIRQAFVAAPGHLLVSCDYSQIELRILAHFSGDPSLCEAFSHGEDVHRRTAAEIYGVSPDAVEPEMRRVAKMINYAIAYGLSAHGLSSRIGIDGSEARRVIASYFERYAGIKSWLDRTVEEGRRQGAVHTLLGRRRPLPDLQARNAAVRQAAERAAVNTPIQGTAADIVKKAMIDVDALLRRDWPEARMLLQVHDELLFEVPESQAEALGRAVAPVMERAVQLRVPLVVDVGIAPTWAGAH